MTGLRFLTRRLFQGLIVVIGVLIVVFVAMRIVGDPVAVLLPLDASDEARAAVRAELGLDQPLPVQFADFAYDAVRLDFGDSYVQRVPAVEIIGRRFIMTLQLVVWSTAVAVALSLAAGIIAARMPAGWVNRTIVGLSVLWVSMPHFWLGLILIIVFSVSLGVLPVAGVGGVSHAVLPVVTLALPTTGRLALVARSVMAEEFRRPHIRMGRARGIPNWRLTLHALRNALVAYIAMAGYEFAHSISGHTVVVEVVFAWPGIGLLAKEAIEMRDLPVIQALVGFIAIVIVVVTMIVDVSYRVIDPRISLDEA